MATDIRGIAHLFYHSLEWNRGNVPLFIPSLRLADILNTQRRDYTVCKIFKIRSPKNWKDKYFYRNENVKLSFFKNKGMYDWTIVWSTAFDLTFFFCVVCIFFIYVYHYYLPASVKGFRHPSKPLTYDDSAPKWEAILNLYLNVLISIDVFTYKHNSWSWLLGKYPYVWQLFK